MARSSPKRGASRRRAGRARRPARRRAGGGNGLRTFAMHRGDAAAQAGFRSLDAHQAGHPGFAGLVAVAGQDLSRVDPETAARQYLVQALEDEAVPELTAPRANDAETQFNRLGTEYVPLTGTRTVKFRQAFNGIPVYGSLVTVELDERNECLAISSALGEPQGVDPVAKVAPAEIAAKAVELAGLSGKEPPPVPRLHYYYDAKGSRWRLVYIVEDVPVERPRRRTARHAAVEDFVFDAHSGALVAELARAARAFVTTTAIDALGVRRTFECETSGARQILRGGTLNVHTYDFAFRDPVREAARLPGARIVNPPPWDPGAVSAHANAEEVARFLRDVLKRNSIDNRGGAMVSTIRCVVRAEARDPEEWLNAYWNGRQMVYGQRREGSGLRTMAANVDVVGHEMFHGVTDHTARLEYESESGALNESYSDIFGVIVSNGAQPSLDAWNWEVGEGLSHGGAPFRDVRNPERHGQPRHLRDYQHLPSTEAGDWGGVHINSGIHNYAFYRVLAAKRGRPRRYVFAPAEVAAMFYICLTQYLSRRSTFLDSRRGVLLAARTLFRTEPAAAQRARIRAIEAGFSAAGIEEGVRPSALRARAAA